jgi:Flp pilus assembly protein TadG
MRACRSPKGERGQALVVTTIFMTVVLGAAALTIDIGRMASNKRQIQNGADAAALAGAWQLPGQATAAKADALAWALNNNLTGDEVMKRSVFTTDEPDDTIEVEVKRNVTFTFGKVVGLSSKDLTARATVQVPVLTGIKTGQPRAFPFAVWDGNPKKIKMGDTVTFRSNNYAAANVDKSVDCTQNKNNKNCTWDIKGANFKGYFHWQNGYNLYVKPTKEAFSQGGNAFGTAELQELWQYYEAGIPVILPVINYANDPSGNQLDFVIPAFVCVKITQLDQQGAIDWKGEIVKCAANGLHDGPNQPSIKSAFVPVLIH